MTALGPLPPLDHVLRIVLSGSVDNHPWNSVQHAQYQGAAIDVNTCNTLAASVGTAWVNAIAPVSGSGTILTGVAITDLTNNTSAQGSASMTHPGTGLPGVGMNAASCWVQSLTTVLRYRGGHPRIYWPANDPGGLTNGSQFSGAYVLSLGTAATGWISNVNNLTVNSIGLQHGCAFYYTHDPVTKVRMYRNPPLFKPTIATAAHKRLDTQRRRLGVEIP